MCINSTENTVSTGTCCIGTREYYNCFDCTSKPSGDYICTYGVLAGVGCPQKPA